MSVWDLADKVKLRIFEAQKQHTHTNTLTLICIVSFQRYIWCCLFSSKVPIVCLLSFDSMAGAVCFGIKWHGRAHRYRFGVGHKEFLLCSHIVPTNQHKHIDLIAVCFSLFLYFCWVTVISCTHFFSPRISRFHCVQRHSQSPRTLLAYQKRPQRSMSCEWLFLFTLNVCFCTCY